MPSPAFADTSWDTTGSLLRSQLHVRIATPGEGDVLSQIVHLTPKTPAQH